MRTEQHLLQGVRERADGELGHEPQQVGRETTVGGGGADGVLVPGQRAGQQRTGFERAGVDHIMDMVGRVRRRRRAPIPAHSCSSTGLSTAVGIGIGSPASAGMPFLSLAAR